MFGGIYFGGSYFGGFTSVTAVRRILRGTVAFLNGIRSIRRVRT